MAEDAFGVAETLSKAKNTAVNGLVEAGVVKAKAGKVKLVSRSELPDGWDPTTDTRLTVWETTQHLIRTLETKGEIAAAGLVNKLGGMAETARDLAYRLYSICERKKWAEEALAYNSLVIAWPELNKLALAERNRAAIRDTAGDVLMLMNLSLQNFKCWKRIDRMRLAPITGLFGANSSGKTSILQWLLLLDQTIESSDWQQVFDFGDERSYVQLGTFRDIIYGHSANKLSWSLTFKLLQKLTIADPEKRGSTLFAGDQIIFSASVAQDDGGRLFVPSISYAFAEEEFRLELGARAAKPSARDIGRGEYRLIATDSSGFRFKRNPGRVWPLPHPVNCFGFPNQVMTYYQNAGFLGDLQYELQRQFYALYYLGPLRDNPRSQYVWGGTQPTDVGRRGEKVIDAILSARDRGERILRGPGRPRLTLEGCIAEWLRKLGLIDSFEVRRVAEGSSIFQVHVQKTPGSTPVMITDVGFGISQILPVITYVTTCRWDQPLSWSSQKFICTRSRRRVWLTYSSTPCARGRCRSSSRATASTSCGDSSGELPRMKSATTTSPCTSAASRTRSPS